MTPSVLHFKYLWYKLWSPMAKDEILRARVEKELAEQVERWAEDRGTDVSEAIRIALRRLVEEAERRRRIEAARDRIDELAETGIFEEPEDDRWKASGGWS